MSEDIRPVPFLLAAALLGAGCRSYAVPGRPADLAFLMQDQATRDAAADERPADDLSLEEILARHPTVAFPTSIAVVRLQAPEPEQPSWYGAPRPRQERFTVVTRRDVETDASLQRLRELPQIAGIAGVNQLVLPERIDSEVDLRKVAARLHADMLLVYTLDTSEELDDESPFFSLLTLGLLPTHEIEVRTTASAVLVDTRTGYCYGLAEASASDDPHTPFWNWEENLDETRQAVEREAFARLVDDFAATWTGVVSAYAGAVPSQ